MSSQIIRVMSTLKHKPKIKDMGIEIEGCWYDEPTGANFHHDGSVCHFEGEYAIGEIASDPMKYDNIVNYIDMHYPDEVNETCGIHVHFSFVSPYYYQKLMTSEFHNYLKAELLEFGKIQGFTDEEYFNRLNGKNDYCYDSYRAKEQLHDLNRNSSRYCFINYCYDLHKTLEIRVLPAFNDKEHAIIAVKKLRDIIESWLKKKTNKKRRLIKTVNITENKIEVLNICV